MQPKHTSEYAVQVSHCTKTFGKVVANDDVQFSLRWGEIHALLGENGSGKTTLVNMLSGIYQPDAGEIQVDGKPVTILTPRDAYALGIGMIHQHFMLVDVLTAAENIVLGLKGSFLLGRAKVNRQIEEIVGRYGFRIKPDQRVSEMSVSEKQTVEIVKALYRGAEILILDEPTAVLTPQETDRLFEVLKAMKAQGKAIVLISHKMNELFAVADRVTILRRGRYIEDMDMAESTVEKLTSGMVGHAIDLSVHCTEGVDRTEDVLSVSGLSVTTADGVARLKDVSFSVCGGEILGIAGVAGSGQRELCDAIAGICKPQSGSIRVKGHEIASLSPEVVEAQGIRIAYVPEDRLGMGLVPSLGMADNVMLRCYRDSKGPFLDRKTPEATCQQIIRQLDVNTPGTKTPVRRLSGGNVQKVLLGREIHAEPDVLICSYPVRGLDIGASQKIYSMMNEQKARGACVLFVGEDLDTLMGLCDRLVVLCNGKVRGVVDPRKVSRNDIGLMMMDDGRGEKAV